MPWLFINTFEGGINTDDARVKRNQALKMENLDISKKGLMKKRRGFVDKAINGTPTTLQTIFEWSSAVPNDQNLLAEVTSSDISQLHQSSDAASFIILKEMRGAWMSGISGSRIPSQTGILEIGVASLTGIPIATGDTEMSRTDDVYNNWILINNNAPQGGVIITDYIGSFGAGGGRFIKPGSDIQGASNNGEYYILKFDWDKIHMYAQFKDIMRGGGGIASQELPFFLKHIVTTIGLGLETISDYILVNNDIKPGNYGTFIANQPVNIPPSAYSIFTVANLSITPGLYWHRFSVVYDGVQESQLNPFPISAVCIEPGSGLNINMYMQRSWNPRVSAVKFYRAAGTLSAPTETFKFIGSLAISASGKWNVTSDSFYMPNAGTGGGVDVRAATFLDNVEVISVGDSYVDTTGIPEGLLTRYAYNYKYEVQIGERRFIAGVGEEAITTTNEGKETQSEANAETQLREYNEYPNRVYWSHITPKLVICPDIFLPDNFMLFDQGGTDVITGLARVLRNMIIFLENTTFVVRMTSGNVLTWEKVETISGIGCIAPQSIADAAGNVIFAGRDNIYVFDLTSPRPLLDDKFEEDYQAISNKSSGVGIYYPKRRQYKITFSETETSINGTASEFITYVIDLKSGAVHKHHSLKDSISYAVGIDGELFRTDGTIIMEDDNSSFTETIGIGYRSSMIDAGTPGNKHWKEILLHYQSDDDVKVKIYLRQENEGRFGVSPLEITFPAEAGSMTTRKLKINQQAEAIQLEIYTANSANTTVKIGQIGLNYEQLERTAA